MESLSFNPHPSPTQVEHYSDALGFRGCGAYLGVEWLKHASCTLCLETSFKNNFKIINTKISPMICKMNVIE